MVSIILLTQPLGERDWGRELFEDFSNVQMSWLRTAAGAIRCRHSTNSGIRWLRVKPWIVIGHGILAGKYLAKYRDSLI